MINYPISAPPFLPRDPSPTKRGGGNGRSADLSRQGGDGSAAADPSAQRGRRRSGHQSEPPNPPSAPRGRPRPRGAHAARSGPGGSGTAPWRVLHITSPSPLCPARRGTPSTALNHRLCGRFPLQPQTHPPLFPASCSPPQTLRPDTHRTACVPGPGRNRQLPLGGN